MKSIITGMLLALTFSFSAFADSVVVDVADLGECGGIVELRTYVDGGVDKYALQFRGVDSCSNVRLSTGKSYKLTDRDGNYLDKNITLSNDAIAEAKSVYGLQMLLESNSGKTSVEVAVEIADTTYVPSYPTTTPAPTSW